MADKPKLALYWSSSCGGCEVAVVNLNERLLEVADYFDFFFCPCLLDTKKADVEALPDGAITATLFNGAIRTDENVEMAELLRRKSRILVSFGACAAHGGIPGLANLASRGTEMDRIYRDSPSLDNPEGVVPTPRTEVPEGVLHGPRLLPRVQTLAQTVPVDYIVPGCPPEPDQIWNVMRLFMSGAPLPDRGSVLGAGHSTVCDECSRTRTEKTISGFRRVWEFVPDETTCLLEQGLLCAGVATRSGCGGLCPQVNMPCIGCYGAPDGVYDQSAKLVAAIGSILDIDAVRGLRDEHEIYEHVDRIVATLPDVAGAGGKFSTAARARATFFESPAENDSEPTHAAEAALALETV